MYQQDVPPAPMPPEQAAMHDARAVHDAATLRFAPYAGGPGGPQWILARIDPAPQSGNTTIPGAYIQDGRVVEPPQAKLMRKKLGKWTRLAAEGAEPADGGPYSWMDPLDEEPRAASPEDIFSPFVRGGVVLFRPGAMAASRLLPADFAADAPAAMRLASHYHHLLDLGPATDAERAKLVALIGHGNRLIAAGACRQALAIPESGRSAVLDRFHRAKGSLLAVLTFLLLADDAIDELNAAAKTAPPETLRAYALGGAAAQLFGPPAQKEPARQFLQNVRAALRGSTDPYLRVLLEP